MSPFLCAGKILLLLLLLGCSPSAFANMAKPWSDGEPAAEPIGSFRNIHIRKETLTFDARGLDTPKRTIHVRAVYHIENMAGAVRVPLFFVAPGLSRGRVALDGQLLSSQKVNQKVPTAWGLVRRSEQGMLFHASLRKGKHRIAVSYDLVPTIHYNPRGLSVRLYSFRYVFAPVRRWASFGSLDVRVLMPDGWLFHKDPLGLRKGEKGWSRTYKGIPADVVEVSFHPAQGLWPLRLVPLYVVWIVLLLVVLLLAWRHLHVFRGSHLSAWSRNVRSVGFVLGGAILVGVLNWLALLLMLMWLQAFPHVVRLGYGALGLFAIGSVLLPCGICVLVPVLWWLRGRQAS